MPISGPAKLRLSLRSWLVLSHVTVFVLAISFWVGSGSLSGDLRAQTRWDLEHQGVVLAVWAQDMLENERARNPHARLEDLSERLSKGLRRIKESNLSGIRLTDEVGKVVATSGSHLGDVLIDTPEVAQALTGESVMVVRPRPPASRSQPLSSPSRRAGVRVFVAIPIVLDDQVVGTVLLSRTPREWLQALYQMVPHGLLLGALGAMVCTLALALLVGDRLSRSLRALNQAANRLSEGDFDVAKEGLDYPQSSRVAEVGGLATSVRAMTSRLQDRLNYIGEFASNVSHEFKTPLATMKGTLELLDDDPEMPGSQRALFLSNAGREVQRLEDLVNGLLTLARIDQGGQDEPVALGELARRVAGRLAVQIEVDSGDLCVTGDEHQLNVALSNLVRNALKYGQAPIVVRCFRRQESVIVEVQDAGEGISENNQKRVLERFFTTDRKQGNGLGLSLVTAIARRHAGELSFTSEPGETVFSLRLPHKR